MLRYLRTELFVVFGRTHERNERDNSEEYALAIEKSIIENAVFFAPVSENDRNVLFFKWNRKRDIQCTCIRKRCEGHRAEMRESFFFLFQ